MPNNFKEQLKTLPRKPGVYFFRNHLGIPLYIGKAKDIAVRVKQHLTPPYDTKHIQLFKESKTITFESCTREEEALLLEQRLIKKHLPRYNIEWKDDKNFISIGLCHEEFPRLFLVHQKIEPARRQTGNKKVEYFGPFVDSRAVRALLRYISRILPCCTCASKKRHHCLAWKLWGRRSERPDPNDTIRAIRALIRQGTPKLRTELEGRMERASMRRQYERAAALRDIIKRLDRISAKTPPERSSCELERGIRQIQALAKILGFSRMPVRIEGYDISNIQGEYAYGSMVVFLDGLPRRDLYRLFRIRTVKGANDVAMIREVLNRRIQRLGKDPKTWPSPDIILVDGGKPQLNAASEVIKKFHTKILVIALAKREERIFLKDKDIKLSEDNQAQKLVQSIRDEAHRFARKHTRRLHRRKIRD